MVMINKDLHTERFHRQFVSRKKNRGKFPRIEDCIDHSIKEIGDYVKQRKENVITATSNSTEKKGTNRNNNNNEIKISK